MVHLNPRQRSNLLFFHPRTTARLHRRWVALHECGGCRRGGHGQEPLSATNAEAFEGALLAGIGIALRPDFLAWKALSAARLVAVLVGRNPPPGALNVLMPPGRPRASRVAVLLDFLIRRFTAGSAPWTAGLPVAAQ
jgi:DNA-binding transcriptional LysR family regulator